MQDVVMERKEAIGGVADRRVVGVATVVAAVAVVSMGSMEVVEGT